MEWCVPLQKLEVPKIVLGNLQVKPHRETKPIAPLGYIDGAMVMPVLTVLLPHLIVESYNSADGRLELILDSPQSIGKLTSIQTALITSITNSQHSWFGTRKYSQSELNDFFQPMIDGNKLHLYCPSTLVDKRKGTGVIRVWKEGSWIEGVRPGLFAPGQKIRVALQIQGVSLQLMGDSVWTGRSRLQHRILGIFLQTPKSLTVSSEAPKHSQQ